MQPHIRDLHGRTPKSRRRIRAVLTGTNYALVGESDVLPKHVSHARRLATDRGFTAPKPAGSHLAKEVKA